MNFSQKLVSPVSKILVESSFILKVHYVLKTFVHKLNIDFSEVKRIDVNLLTETLSSLYKKGMQWVILDQIKIPIHSHISYRY